MREETGAGPRVGVVMITHDRREEDLAAVGRPPDLPERPRVVMVDNGSGDGTGRPALTRTVHLSRTAPGDRAPAPDALDAVRGAGRVLAERRPVPATVEARLSAVDGAQRTSPARRYVA